MRRSRFNKLPTPIYFRNMNSVIITAKIAPRRLFAKSMEKVKKVAKKRSIKNNITDPNLYGSTKYTSIPSDPQSTVIAINVGRKFFLNFNFLFLSVLLLTVLSSVEVEISVIFFLCSSLPQKLSRFLFLRILIIVTQYSGTMVEILWTPLF